MFNINEDEILVRVRNYQLLRSDGTIYIGVCERIGGTSYHKFMAYPSGFIGDPEKTYCGFGDTETKALRGFLNRIKSVSTKEIKDSIKDQMSLEPQE